MTRKRILYLISMLTLVVGLMWIWSFLSPIFSSSQPKVLDPVLAIIGFLFLVAGWSLFRLGILGLELSFWLWFVSLMWSLLSIVFSLPTEGNFVVPANLPVMVFILAWVALHLFIVIFLGQRATKEIFAPNQVETFTSK